LIIAEMMSLAILPTMLGLSIVAPEAVRLIMGAKWVPVAGPLRWLCLFMIIRVLGVLAEQVLVSQFQTRFTMRMAIVGFCVMPIAFYVAGKWMGLGGVAAAWAMMSPLTVLPVVLRVLPRIKMPWLEYANALLPAAAGSIVMCVALLGLRSWHGIESWPLALRLVAEIMLSGIVYGAVIMLFFRKTVLRYFNFLANLKNANQASEPVTVPQ
jgi:PST family polysaccharide transporter